VFISLYEESFFYSQKIYHYQIYNERLEINFEYFIILTRTQNLYGKKIVMQITQLIYLFVNIFGSFNILIKIKFSFMNDFKNILYINSVYFEKLNKCFQNINSKIY
jgi:hypothetical protein